MRGRPLGRLSSKRDESAETNREAVVRKLRLHARERLLRPCLGAKQFQSSHQARVCIPSVRTLWVPLQARSKPLQTGAGVGLDPIQGREQIQPLVEAVRVGGGRRRLALLQTRALSSNSW